MPAAQYDFLIEQGATLVKTIIWKDSLGEPIPLSGFSAKMQVRKSAQSPEVLLELSTQNGRITLGATSGVVTMTFGAGVTAAIDWTRGKYDLELVSGAGVVTRLLEGEITVSREITR